MFPGLLNSLADTDQDFQAAADRFIPSLLDAPQTIISKLSEIMPTTTGAGLGYMAAKGARPAGTLFSGAGPDDPMLIQHKLSPDNIEFVSRELGGGIPMPSVAVTKADNYLQSFGDVALLGDMETFGPRQQGSHVFNTDVYSSRFPEVENVINWERLNELNADVSDVETALAGGRATDIFDPGVIDSGVASILDHTSAHPLIYRFLKSIGKAPKIEMEPLSVLPDRLKHYGDRRQPGTKLDLINDPEWVRKAEKREDWFWGRLDSTGEYSEPGRKALAEFAAEDQGLLVNHWVSHGKGQVATQKSKIAVQDVLFDGSYQTRFKDWLQDNYGDVIKGKRLFRGFTDAGNRRYLPFTPENARRVMIERGIRLGEGFSAGPGTVRAAMAKEYRTPGGLLADRGKLEGAHEHLGTHVDPQLFSELSTRVRDELSPQGSSWIGDDLLQDIAQNSIPAVERDMGRKLLPGTRHEVQGLLDDMKNLPAPYFEGKVNRVVPLSDFKGAVMQPRYGGTKDIQKILREHGIRDIAHTQGNSKQEFREILDRYFKNLLFSGVPISAALDQGLLGDQQR